MPSLVDAILLAVEAHRHQTDRAGEPYCLHPLRVMLRLRSEEERLVGILHDLIEDTPYTIDDIRSLGYPPGVLEAVECLTRREGEGYEQFIDRLRDDPVARRVKLADLEDNMDVTRLREFSEKDAGLMRRYVKAWHALHE